MWQSKKILIWFSMIWQLLCEIVDDKIVSIYCNSNFLKDIMKQKTGDKRKVKEDKGITLVSLAVTIIISLKIKLIFFYFVT